MKALFSESGPLAKHVAGYTPRGVQLEMAEAVAAALAKRSTLVIEAGTGTGKTFAYLAPALLSGGRTIISTGTLNLQDQLFHRDLPRLRAALDVPVNATLLKGRANYLCRYRLDRTLQQAGRRDRLLKDVAEWSRRTERGELQELAQLPDDDPLVPRITSTADNCLGSQCPDFEQCFVVQARRKAQAADVVVVNHHLLFADFVLREEGFGQILPGADAVIVDEAHQLPEIASRFFGTRISTRQVHGLAEDCAAEAAALKDVPALRDAAAGLVTANGLLEGLFAGVSGRERMESFHRRAGAGEALAQLGEALDELGAQLKPLADRTPGLSATALRCNDLKLRLDAQQHAQDDSVAWVEVSGRGGVLHTTPVRVDEGFDRLREAYPGAWIFTSATLAAGGDFSHFCGQLGLERARTVQLDSPFEFERQARLYLPLGLPDPKEPAYIGKVMDVALPVIEASGGGAFVLCTSHRALREAAARVKAALPLPLFVQGEGSRAELLEAFARAGNGVLVGTSSFWEGVDVRGQALRLVIIDKLPFAAPGDPVFDARLGAIREAGGDPFNHYQLPQAIVSLRQGVGRLIRDAGDRGLLMLCDPRLRSRPYGKRILASLPSMPLLSTQAEVETWLREIRQAA